MELRSRLLEGTEAYPDEIGHPATSPFSLAIFLMEL
jgi:hypothetical protein